MLMLVFGARDRINEKLQIKLINNRCNAFGEYDLRGKITGGALGD
ncbi:MAG TPA: hypothetical protein P5316_18700 [Phycisphaerae bacterium]|jgi:hypothetical protein|nr:hypothetical protein [Phycisphaerae bacterium]